MTEPVFTLFACCIPVRGARRSVICDLQRQSFHFIPNGLYEILTEHAGESIAAIHAAYDHQYDEEIVEYFAFLEQHELGFWCGDPGRFPAIDLHWETPERITNAILDVDEHSDHDYGKILAQLDDLGCKALEVRCFHRCGVGDLRPILEAARCGRLRSIDLLIGFGPELTPEALAAVAAEHKRVSSIVVHSAPESRVQPPDPRGVVVAYRTEVIDSPRCCGKIHPGYFTVDLETFAEGRKFNTCLNRKLSVDARGEIKGCPSLPKSYGNVRDVPLHSALAQRDFSALWSINKDQIAVCKDCEFRYICTDCRAYLSDESDLYSKPSKCNYDPYTAEWQPPAEERTSAGSSTKGES
ncbi:MAG TPA: grasp-with-spasm system SPASM domain peptide maturase [Thermoanaerobaculia bacterium]|jgi:SPASM domain peptide maturase of grasp-with-spasm system|nr:grasp-with-spasm system SPASM domain peptide maturase [Thermoanaerobaculia bacterium]